MLKTMILCLAVASSFAATACVMDAETDAEEELSVEESAIELCPDVRKRAPGYSSCLFIYKPTWDAQLNFTGCTLERITDCRL